MISFKRIGQNNFQTLPETSYEDFRAFVADLRATGILVTVFDRDGIMSFSFDQ